MDTEGLFAPESAQAAREQYAAVETAARGAVREFARTAPLAADVDTVREDADLVLTAQEVIFASLLEVHLGTRVEFEDWLGSRERAVETLGSEHVPRVAWHDAPFAGAVLAATYDAEPEAAADTLRRQAFARHYREVVE
jgi:hypothetical protein